jgi:hypothetical protein
MEVISINDAGNSGNPSISKMDKNVAQKKDVVHEYRHISI